MKVSQVLFSTLQHGNPKIIDEELTRLVNLTSIIICQQISSFLNCLQIYDILIILNDLIVVEI